MKYDLNFLMTLTKNFATIGVVVNCFEIIKTKLQYSEKGIFNWAILKTSDRWLMKNTILNSLFKYPNFIILIYIQLISALLLLINNFSNFYFINAIFIFITLTVYLLYNLRNQFGLDGSDQMQVILFSGLLLYYVFPNNIFIQTISFLFIALQSVLSYLTAGIAKLVSVKWRSGVAIIGITNTFSYGGEKITRFFDRFIYFSRFVCWCVIIFECTFPLSVLFGKNFCLIYLFFGVFFHLIIGLMMGLNSFFWSFCATYPSILYLSILVAEKLLPT